MNSRRGDWQRRCVSRSENAQGKVAAIDRVKAEEYRQHTLFGEVQRWMQGELEQIRSVVRNREEVRSEEHVKRVC